MKNELNGLYDTLILGITQSLRDTHTIVVAKVVLVNEKTVDVRPVISRSVNNEKVDLPVFKNVPPVFLQGGRSYTAHPIAVGDYCLLLVSERCFDLWYYGQDYKEPLSKRIMDYSDAFCLVGVNPLSDALTIPQVITSVGDAHITGNYTHVGDLNLTGNINVTGNITATGSISAGGDVSAGGGSVTLLGHTHAGVHGQTSTGSG